MYWKMRYFKRTLRLGGLVLLIMLVSIGLGGGAPIPRLPRKENKMEIGTEVKDSKEEVSHSQKTEIKS